MRATASVVIIGAGIVGCGAAYHLTRLGWRDVVVLEQGPLFQAGGSTSHAPGLVFQTNGSKTICTLAQESVALYETLELDGEPGWYRSGSLEVAQTPERLEELKRRHGFAQAYGLESSLIGPEAAAAMIPLLDPAAILGAYHVPNDGVCKGVRVSEAMARMAIAAGAEFHARTPVTGFVIEGGRIRGVDTPAGRIATDRVLCCAGIWGPTVGALAGVPIPLMPCEHALLWTEPMPEFAGETREVASPILRAQDKDLYGRQRRDGYAIGSYRHAPVLVDASAIRPHAESGDMPASNPFDAEAFAPSWRDAIDLMPALARTKPAEAINGMFSFTPDANPLMGESARLGGFWTCEAIWVTHAGGAAKAIAEWMTHGRAELDMRECDINRFEPHQTTKSFVEARARQQYIEVYDIIHPLQPMEEPRPMRQTPFYDREKALGAVFFEGSGWERPRWYQANARLQREYAHAIPERFGWESRFWSPLAATEHLATRERAGLFDMTPLPKIEVSGTGAAAFLQGMLSNDVDVPTGKVVYALMLDERGTIRSDVTVARLATDRYLICCNGPLDLVWLRRHAPVDGSVTLRDVTAARACLGLWGPRARDILSSATSANLATAAFPYFAAREIEVGEVPVTALRVSYVGELGYELYCDAEYGGRLWDLLWRAGEGHGLIAAGRAAFEAMRLEKGYRLWGADMETEHDPWQAGVGFAVKLGRGEFIGREAAARAKAAGPATRLRALRLDQPGAVVMGKEPIVASGGVAGYVTSAAYGYSVGHGIAYGYLPATIAEGDAVEIRYFGRSLPATVMSEPLFDPKGERLRV